MAMKYLSLSCLAAVLILALGADILAPYSPWERFAPFELPSKRHPLGTNDLGNDILSEFIHAGRVSLLTGAGAGGIATVLGLLLGLTAGWFGGVVRELIIGLADVFLLIPRLPLLLCFGAFFSPSYRIIILLLGFLWWPAAARVSCAKTLHLKTSPFVLVNRCAGFSGVRILFSDILPHIAGVIFPQFLLSAASAMVSESSLSFLGLGDPGVKSWGTMIQWAFNKGGFINEKWWWLLPPGFGIFIALLGAGSLEYYLAEKNEGIRLDL
jgi:peptide/nickel transport system permease protein